MAESVQFGLNMKDASDKEMESRPASSRRLKQIRVDYFAVLKEARGQSSETVESEAPDARALYSELKEKHNFNLSFKNLSVAINDEFADWDTKIRSGDKVVFIPPVAGG